MPSCLSACPNKFSATWLDTPTAWPFPTTASSPATMATSPSVGGTTHMATSKRPWLYRRTSSCACPMSFPEGLSASGISGCSPTAVPRSIVAAHCLALPPLRNHHCLSNTDAPPVLASCWSSSASLPHRSTSEQRRTSQPPGGPMTIPPEKSSATTREVTTSATVLQHEDVEMRSDSPSGFHPAPQSGLGALLSRPQQVISAGSVARGRRSSSTTAHVAYSNPTGRSQHPPQTHRLIANAPIEAARQRSLAALP